MPQITIWPENTVIQVEEGERLLDILLNINRDILSICGGMGECETCVVEVQTTSEKSIKKIKESDFFQTLACQTYINRDIVVKIPDWRNLF
jgi:ferredoxin